MERIREAADIQQALAVTELRNGNGRGLFYDEKGRKKKEKKKTFLTVRIDEPQIPSHVDGVKSIEPVHT
ncbi:MAG: hypothetical protein U9P50_02965 [Patescibacteria group bacterium]|nr:hypothetical protein [Patescibacteria group bacterium]